MVPSKKKGGGGGDFCMWVDDRKSTCSFINQSEVFIPIS